MTLLADFKEARRLGKLPVPTEKIGGQEFYGAEAVRVTRQYSFVLHRLLINRPILTRFLIWVKYL